jgi:hypothetical protein
MSAASNLAAKAVAMRRKDPALTYAVAFDETNPNHVLVAIAGPSWSLVLVIPAVVWNLHQACAIIGDLTQ